MDITKIIANTVSGIGNSISKFASRSEELYSARIIETSKNRSQGSLMRNLPIIVVVIFLFLFLIVRSKNK